MRPAPSAPPPDLVCPNSAQTLPRLHLDAYIFTRAIRIMIFTMLLISAISSKIITYLGQDGVV